MEDLAAARIGATFNQYASGTRAALLREPIHQIEHDAGKQTRFRDTEEKAQHVEAQRTLHEGASRRDGAPDEQDREHPAPRTEPDHHEIRGHLKQHVAEKEDAGAKAEDGGRECEIAVHGQRGEADIDAIDQIDGVKQSHQRDQPPRAFGEDFVVVGHQCPHAPSAGVATSRL